MDSANDREVWTRKLCTVYEWSFQELKSKNQIP